MTVAFHETPPAAEAAMISSAITENVPTLETERLSLRAPQIADFEAYFDILDGPRGQFIMPQPVSRAEVWADYCSTVATWLLRGHGIWSVTKKHEGRVEGFVLIGAEPGDQCHELGYLVSADAEGKGIAFEAAVAARDWAWNELKVPELVSYVATGNARSAKLARRLGAVQSAAFDSETHVFHYSKPEVAQ